VRRFLETVYSFWLCKLINWIRWSRSSSVRA